MEFTRVETAAVQARVAAANGYFRLALTELQAVLVALTDEERESLLRPSVRFPEAGRAMIRAAADYPDLAERAEFEIAGVQEDLDNAGELASAQELLDQLARLVDDSRLLWLAEAYVPSLALYRLAKAAATVDGTLEALVKPLEDVFASRRKPVKA
jgi:hypothetical protein